MLFKGEIMQAVTQGIITSTPTSRIISGREYTWSNLSYHHPRMKDDTENKITVTLLEYGPDIKLNKGDKVRVYGHFQVYEERGIEKMKLLVSEYDILNRPAPPEKKAAKQEEQLSLF